MSAKYGGTKKENDMEKDSEGARTCAAMIFYSLIGLVLIIVFTFLI